MKMKKLLSLVLVLALALTAFSAFAEDAAEADWIEEDFSDHADIRYELAGDYTGKTVILHSNDVHGQIDGYAYIAGLRSYFESLGAEVLLADCGDFSQGSVYASTSKGASMVDMMNAAGYNVVTLGNHEFDFGYEKLMENLSKANFSAVCATITLDETGESILPGAVVLTTKAGLKIGFVGVETPETVTKVNPGLISMLTFASGEALAESVQKAIDSVRGEADLVFGLFHLGVDDESKFALNRSVDLFPKLKGLDFVLDAHGHTLMTRGQHNEPIQSTATKFESIGVVVIDNEAKGIEANFLIPTYLGSKLYGFAHIDEAVQAKAKEIAGAVDTEYSSVFAKTEVRLNGDKAPGNRTEETNLGDLITDAMVWSVVKEGGIEQVEPNAVVGITNGGGIRATIEAGDISMKDVNTVLPFGNTVAVVYVTGAELLEVLEASTFCTPDAIGGFPQTSGIEWTIDTTKPYEPGEVYVLNGKESNYAAPASINRVTINSVNGQPFDLNATYAVITNNFCTAGGDTYNVFARSESRFDTGIPLDEALMAYISEALGGVITADKYGEPRGTTVELK